MLITITRTLDANVHKVVVETEANALDQAYMKAYGEPRVSMGGVLSYPDASRTAQVVSTGDAFVGVEEDAPNARTILKFRTGAVDLDQFETGDKVTLSGMPNPALNGEFDVVAIDEIHNAIAIDLTGVPTADPYTTAVAIGTVTIGAQIEGQAISGFTDDTTDLVIQLKTGTAIDLSSVTPSVDSIVIAGVTLEPGLNGSHLITAVDNTAKTVTIASLSLTSQAAFAVDTPKGDLVDHELSAVQFIAPASEVYIRSSSPFTFQLHQSTDSAAAAKTKAWAEDLRDKIAAATLTLKGNPDPNTEYPIVETTEVF